MPYLGGGGPGGSGSPYVRPPPPPPPPRAPVPRAPGQSGQVYTPPPAPRVNPARVNPTAPPTHTDITSSGPGYGSARANAYKASPAYKQTVAQVFRAQPPAQKAAIIRGLVHMPASPGFNPVNTPEFQAIRGQWQHLSIPEQNTIQALIPHDLPNFIAPKGGLDLGNLLSSSVKDVYGLLSKPNDFRANAIGSRPTPVESGLTGLGKLGGNLIQHIPTGIGMPKEQRGIMEASALGPGQVGKNFAKDLVNLPAEALPSVAIPIEQAANNHWQQALQAITQPYQQAIRHPLQALTQHPLNTFLMFSGPTHGAARLVDTAQSLARTGGLPSVRAESVHLTGNLTHERPDFSKSPITRFSQKSVAKQLYRRNKQGQLVPRSDQVRARLIKLETSRLVGQNERVRVAHRQQQINAHAATVLQPRLGRVAHGLRTAAKYNPEPALIPGAHVLARIADTTIRRPDTIAQDLMTHRDQVAANRPNLTGSPKLLAEHDAYVKTLQDALNNKAFLRNPHAAFKAAAQYAKDYAPLEKGAHDLGHFGNATQEGLQRRALAHYAITHMGAKFDRQKGELVDAQGRPLSNGQIVAHLNGPNGTGGRMPAFTSDQARAGDKAFMINGQHRPPTAMKGNTYFAFTHGLTHPGHESLLEQRARTQGIVDAHHSMNRLADQLLLQNERTGNTKAWQSYRAAKMDAPEGYIPIRLAQPFHPQGALKKALDAGNVNMATLEEEAAHRQLDINSRLQPSSEPGLYGLIDEHAAEQLRAHENLISPNAFLRSWRSATGQFRRVALATSFRHLPGVAQEQILRAAAEGTGPISLLAGRAVLRRAEQINPRVGEQRRIEMGGGAASGQAISLQTRQVSRHFDGTLLHGPLNAFEKLMAAPGARQIRGAWRTWMRFTLQGTKHVLEQNAQISAIGKQAIADFGGRHGVLAAAMGNWGKMVDQAAHGILDESQARRTGAYIRRVYGRWTDLTPAGQQALMFSPFGMWWTNSVAWLARMPVDHPMGAAFLAGLNSGTEQQRQQLGLDMFSPNHLPLYKQGGIPVGSKLWGANYYSAFGVASDPGETAQSLFMPYEMELARAAGGQNWLGETITSPANPKGHGKPGVGDVGTVIANSLLSSFIPLYTKAQTIVTGGASTYDTSTLFAPQTKGPNPGLLAGVKKAVMPIRLSPAAAASAASSGSGGWGGSSAGSTSTGGWGGSSSGSTSTGGWGGSSTSSSGSGGWGP